MSQINRKSFVATAAALAIGAACTFTAANRGVARADDQPTMGASSADMSKMVQDQADKAKAMAADPPQAQQMTQEMAKMMVMDHMAMQMAMDPQAKQAMTTAMQDPAMMKVHEDAKTMAKDPQQMQQMQQQIMADPMAMKMVMHNAMKMSMMKDKMGGMGDQMMEQGQKMMNDQK